jgi:hypothetical protein
MRHDRRTILNDAAAAGEDIMAMVHGMSEVEFISDRRTQRATAA